MDPPPLTWLDTHTPRAVYFILDTPPFVRMCVDMCVCLNSRVYNENIGLHLGCLGSNYERFMLLVFI